MAESEVCEFFSSILIKFESFFSCFNFVDFVFVFCVVENGGLKEGVRGHNFEHGERGGSSNNGIGATSVAFWEGSE